MDQHGVSSFRHRKTPSSDRFLGVFSPPKGGSVLSTVEDNNINDAAAGDDELNEYDVFWTGDFTEPPQRRSSNHLRRSITQPENFGILAALSEDRRGDSNYPLLYRTASLSPPSSSNSFHKTLKSPMAPISRPIPALPKPQTQLPPARKFQQSAPVNVPVFSRKPSRFGPEMDDDDDEMLPPHEIVARSNTAMSTFSVLEGVGRTLKGRDLRQVRNAVWRQTGVLDKIALSDEKHTDT